MYTITLTNREDGEGNTTLTSLLLETFNQLNNKSMFYDEEVEEVASDVEETEEVATEE